MMKTIALLYSNFAAKLGKRLSVVIVLSGAAGCAQMRCPADTRPGDLATRFSIAGGSVKMPAGAFLLIRKNGEIGALRLTNIDPTSTEQDGRSTYESYFQGDGSGSLAASNVLRQTGELSLKPLKGPGRGVFIYQPGQNRARVGKWSFAFVTPTVMGMWPYHRDGDHGYEFAPTSACNLSEVDVHDKRLKWFRYDRNASVILPLAELPN
jgi:hypothetical protein